MTRAFSAPQTVGEKLEEFAQHELTDELDRVICQPCHADDCDDCSGFVALAHLENQIGEAAVEFMKKLVKEWARESK